MYCLPSGFSCDFWNCAAMYCAAYFCDVPMWPLPIMAGEVSSLICERAYCISCAFIAQHKRQKKIRESIFLIVIIRYLNFQTNLRSIRLVKWKYAFPSLSHEYFEAYSASKMLVASA